MVYAALSFLCMRGLELRVYVCVQTVEEFVRRHSGSGTEGAVVVSLSGGVDSMVLCLCRNRAFIEP